MSRMEKGADDLAVAQSVAISEVPLIDFAPFRTGNAQERAAVAAKIADACQQIGFFYITGHGVSDDLRRNIFAQARRFFAQSAEEKAACQTSPDWNRGWIPSQIGSSLTRSSRFFEQFRMQADLAQDDPDVLSGSPFYKPNRWPAAMPEMAAICNAYYTEMERLSSDLLRVFALGLGLNEDRFQNVFRKALSQLSLHYYPLIPADAGVDVSNMVAHTDEGPLTILAQDETGGLEVKCRDGSWIAAPPIEGAFTINVGDMLMWWSNGRYISNLHRVRNRTGVERYTVPFFLNPDFDTIVEPVPELVPPGEQPVHAPVHVGRHLMRFYDSFKTLPKE